MALRAFGREHFIMAALLIFRANQEQEQPYTFNSRLWASRTSLYPSYWHPMNIGHAAHKTFFHKKSVKYTNCCLVTLFSEPIKSRLFGNLLPCLTWLQACRRILGTCRHSEPAQRHAAQHPRGRVDRQPLANRMAPTKLLLVYSIRTTRFCDPSLR